MVGLPRQFDTLWSVGLGAVAAKAVVVGLCAIAPSCSQAPAQSESQGDELFLSSTAAPSMREIAESGIPTGIPIGTAKVGETVSSVAAPYIVTFGKLKRRDITKDFA